MRSLFSLHLFLNTCLVSTLSHPKSTTSHESISQRLLPQITPAPKFIVGRGESVETLLWATDNTCGYLSGFQNSSVTCGGGRCAYYLTSGKPWGNINCCSTAPCTGSTSFLECIDCQNPNLACVNSINFFTYGACDEACVIDSFTLKCTNSREPSCNTLLYPEVNVTDFKCGSIETNSIMTVLTTYKGESERTFYPQVFTSNGSDLLSASTTENADTQPSSASVSNTFGSNDMVGTVTSTGSRTESASSQLTSNSNPTPHAASATTSSNPGIRSWKYFRGPIIGGTIGGAIFLALTSVCIFTSRKRLHRNPANRPHNPEISELESSRQYPSAQPVLHELPDDEVPTFAWHKLWKPSFFHQSRYSDPVPDSPTLGKHPQNPLWSKTFVEASSPLNQPFSSTTRQELSGEDQVSPQQARLSDHIILDETTISPLSPHGATNFETGTSILNHQDGAVVSDQYEMPLNRI